MPPSCAWPPTRAAARPRPIWFLGALALLAAAILPRAARADVTITDDLGRAVTLARPAARVLALYSGLGEVVAELAGLEALVGRTDADTQPPGIAAKPSVGTHMRPTLELILGLKPDVVLHLAGRKEAQDTTERLAALGIPAAVFVIDDFEALFGATARIGVLLGRQEQAARLIAAQRARLAAVASAVAGQPAPPVFFEVRHPDLLAAGKDSLVDDIIRRAGGRNAVNRPGKLARLSEETLLALNPQVYLVQRGPMNRDPSRPQDRPLYAALAAVAAGRVFTVAEDLYSRPSPRSVAAVEDLARLLHPQSFPSK